MQKIRIDFDNPGLPQHISAVENDSQSRFFQATLYENGKAYTAPEEATYSIMYRGFGPQNQGWYDTINDGAGKRAACAVSGNVVTCEIARQALQVPGHVSIVLCVTTGKGYMLKSWPIECDCKNDRYDSTAEIQSFFYITQVTNADWTQAIQAWEDLKNTIDPTLSVSGKAADAAKVGEAVGQLKEDLGDLENSFFNTKIGNFSTFHNAIQGKGKVKVNDKSTSLPVVVYSTGKNVLKSVTSFQYNGAQVNSVTYNGLTCTINSDGTFTLNGEPTKQTVFNVLRKTKNIFEGMVLNGCPENGSVDTYNLIASFYNSNGEWVDEIYDTGNGITINKTFDTIEIGIIVKDNVKINNITFKPMICTKPTDNEYEKYVEKTYTITDNESHEIETFSGVSNVFTYEKINLTATVPINISNYKTLGYVTPEMFGAIGDGVIDDTAAIQKVLNYSNVLLSKNYLITSTIKITGGYKNINCIGSSIIYNGTDFAIEISKLNYADVSFGLIKAIKGSAIKFTKEAQYINLKFNEIQAKNYCIKLVPDNTGLNDTWITETHISDGKLGGYYDASNNLIKCNFGVYADAYNRDIINHINLTNIGIEGVKTGFYLANKCRAWTIISPRYSESYERFIETHGEVTELLFMGADSFGNNINANFGRDDDNDIGTNGLMLTNSTSIKYGSYGGDVLIIYKSVPISMGGKNIVDNSWCKLYSITDLASLLNKTPLGKTSYIIKNDTVQSLLSLPVVTSYDVFLEVYKSPNNDNSTAAVIHVNLLDNKPYKKTYVNNVFSEWIIAN